MFSMCSHYNANASSEGQRDRINFKMDALVGTIVGGMLAIVGCLAAKSFEEWRTRQSLRAAFRAEITGIVLLIETQGHPQMFEATLAHLKRGGQPRPLVVGSHEKPADPIYSKNSDKIGLLGRDVVGEVVRFYSLMDRIREDIRSLSVGELNRFSRKTRIRLLEDDLALWADVKNTALKLERIL